MVNSELQLLSDIKLSTSLQQSKPVLPPGTFQLLSILAYLVFVTISSGEITDEAENE